MIELNQLNQLIVIAQNKTISKAAEVLLISQPALSRSMKRLESELDVQLFDHYINKVVLNKNGELVVNHAKEILAGVEKMTLEVRAFDRSISSISIASCAPAPLWDINPIIKEVYPDVEVISKVMTTDEVIDSLKSNEYQIAFTPFKSNDKDLVSYPYLEEHLYLSLPLNHHLKDKKEISFKELDGETMILYSHIGFWYDLHKRTMPNTKFLIQDERLTFNEIVKASTLPSFTTNLSIKREGRMKNRLIIPFVDKEAHVSFYLTLLKKNTNKYKDLIEKIGSKNK